MYANVLGFAAGVSAVQFAPSLPDPLSWALALCLSLGAAFGLKRTTPRQRGVRRLCLLAAWVAAGCAWSAQRAQWRLADELALAAEGRDLQVLGTIAGLPEMRPGSVVFRFDVERADRAVPTHLRLTWYERTAAEGVLPALAAGQRWRLTVRLKRPHGRANPGGGDAEGRLLQQGVRATGYVRGMPGAELLEPRAAGVGASLGRIREALRARFGEALGDAPWRGMLVAITLGDQAAVPDEHWGLFRRLGIVHLAVVSGLHVTMVAGLAGLAAAALWRRTRLALRWPTPKLAIVAGLLAGWLFAALAGMGLPLQRSVLMLSALAAAMLADRAIARGRMLAGALAVVLVFDPWAVLAPGFWLSFLAVAILLLNVSRGGGERRSTAWLGVVRAQWMINLAMIPALLLFFQEFSLIAPLANLVAIPVVSFVVLPACLLFAVVPLAPLVQFAHLATEWLMLPLGWLAGLEASVWRQAAPPAVMLAGALVACLWCVLPRGTPGRAGAALALVPVLLYAPPRPPEGDYEVVLLDVGQGLAAHVRTARHDLLFDTGPAWPGGDAGEASVLPYLRASGVRRLDQLVVSHADADHAGGTVSIATEIDPGELVSHRDATLPQLGSRRWASCSERAGWSWDGVAFEWLNLATLHPDWSGLDDNERSCVLRIEGRGGRALLTADIGRASERRLIAGGGEGLAAELVVAPHHGSRSSSSEAFVAATGAAAVLFSVGHRSPFGHPHPVVLERWRAAGAAVLRTDLDGAIRARFDQRGMTLASERALRPRYWHGR